jgi:hypothetical protein
MFFYKSLTKQIPLSADSFPNLNSSREINM